MQRIFLLLAFISTHGFAQINESFNDGNFNANPIWIGCDTHFLINTSNELQLNASGAGQSFLVSASQTIENAAWECRLRMGFNPSSGNYARIYLTADNADLSLVQNALFIEVGSTQDNVCLYKIENGTKEKMIEGAADRVDLSAVDIKIKVRRNDDEWLLQSDTGAGYVDEGTANFVPTFASAYFGFYCKYTTTRKNKFFFDDIIVTGDAYKDKNPPIVSNFQFVNGSKMLLSFNEILDESSIIDNCFLLKNSRRRPNRATWNETDRSILLSFNPVLDDVVDEELLIRQLKDLDGNVITDVSFTFSYERTKVSVCKLLNKNTLELTFTGAVPPSGFDAAKLTIDGLTEAIASVADVSEQKIYRLKLNRKLNEGRKHAFTLSNIFDAAGDEISLMAVDLSYYFPKRFDVVINELMVAPSPLADLPETEFIELYNTTAQTINLHNWILNVNGKNTPLPNVNIEPLDFVFLVPSSSSELWNDYNNAIAMQSRLALNNTACDIALYNNNEVMDAYQFIRNNINGEAFKADGGWSVERLDARNVSAEADNYRWCINLSGGTPGLANSTVAENKDDKEPTISYIELLNDTLLHLHFSETMRLFDDIKPEINPKPDNFITSVDTVFLKYLNLHFSKALPINQIYTAKSINITDYAGHQLELDNPVFFGVADSLEAEDILINEVLFNPHPNGVDFVELYNTSDKIIDISDIYLAAIDEGQVEKLYQTGTTKRLLLPQSYLVLTTDKAILQEQYRCKNPKALIEVSSMPSLPDAEGTVALSNRKGQLLETFTYSDKMHFDLIKDDEGVSLERLSWTQAANEASNWHSAASTVAYATPTYQNSQRAPETGISNHTFTASPEVFTPNGNGIDDLLYINYQNDEPGGTSTIRIYNSEGRAVKSLLNNESMAMKGCVVWDGLSDGGEALRPGIYVIYIQSFYPSGKVIEEKLTCVIGSE